MENYANLYSGPIIDQIPRLLTQVNRNRFSRNYGSCCRDYWHYRIMDISNSQKQEVALTLALAYKNRFHNNPYYRSKLFRDWIGAVIIFWTHLQNRNGAYDEVYQNHDSYAATAFTSYMMSETILEMENELPDPVRNKALSSLSRAVNWLAKTEETHAMNQNAGAVAAIYNVYELTGNSGTLKVAEAKMQFLLSHQTKEGWFPEYGGADIGYNSLTLSYLARVWLRTQDGALLKRMAHLLDFLKYFLHQDGTVGGLYGSRNTEYFIPFGVEVLYDRLPEARNISNFIIYHLKNKRHDVITRGLDDRYFLYLSPFYLLAARYLQKRDTLDFDLPLKRPHHVYYPGAKLLSYKNRRYRIIANLGKGGCFRVDSTAKTWVDSGIWAVTKKKQLLTSQHFDPRTEIDLSETEINIRGQLYRANEISIDPIKMILVKLFNLVMPSGPRRLFLDWLRDRAVSKPKSGIFFRRKIRLSEPMEILDEVDGSVPFERIGVLDTKEMSFFFASTSFFQVPELTVDSKMPHGLVYLDKDRISGLYRLERTQNFSD